MPSACFGLWLATLRHQSKGFGGSDHLKSWSQRPARKRPLSRQLNDLEPISGGKHAARKLLKARILLKADVSEAGEGWSDSQIAEALDTSVDTVALTRQRLVEEGFDAALTYEYSPASARPHIFDGAAEAKLIALACSKPPMGRAPCSSWKRRSSRRWKTYWKSTKGHTIRPPSFGCSLVHLLSGRCETA
jgi:hypothetical protein